MELTMNATLVEDVFEKKKVRKRKSALWLHAPKRRKLKETSEQKDPTTPICPPKLTVKPTDSDLRHAPKKEKPTREQPSRKRLFDHSTREILVQEMSRLMPSVLDKLQSAGRLVDFTNLIRLISQGRFPLHNISFLLLLDVVRWYNCDNTSNMFYSRECMKFWKVLYRLFHGKALRFMSGRKSSGQILDETTERGKFDPSSTSINFAVPNTNAVRNFEAVDADIPKEISAGIINEALEMKPKTNAYVLSVDGKKLAPGLNDSWGDQDLFGHEDTETLESLRTRFKGELDFLEELKETWQELSFEEKLEKLQKAIVIVSCRIKDLRQIFLKQTQALKKFQKEAGDDWKTSKYVYAISSVQSMIYMIRNTVSKLLGVNDSLLSLGAALNQSFECYVNAGTLDVYTQNNWITLKDPDVLPEQFRDNVRLTKQRSDTWFEKRSEFRLTGSKLYEGIGLDTLKKLQCHFDKVVRKINTSDDVSEEVRKRMEHGTQSEVHAIATLVGKILPFYFPAMKYIEEGSHEIKSGQKPLILVSPDGSLGKIEMGNENLPIPEYGCEFKCPTPNDYKTPVHYELPVRYIPQILAEMASMNVPKLIYLCWTDESSTVFRATFDAELWGMIFTECEAVYLPETPKRPTRTSECSKHITERLLTYRNQHVEFLCEVSSLKATALQLSQTHALTPYVFPIVTVGLERQSCHIDPVVCTTVSVLKEAYELSRKKATEVLVWLLSDTDRSWDPEVPHSLPIGYAMKGYSLATKVMREMNDHILQSCHDKELNVVCSCFDGQWIKLATRDKNERPLTLIQLQRDVWMETMGTKREDIVNTMKDNRIFNESLCIEKNGSSKMSVSSDILARLMKIVHTNVGNCRTNMTTVENKSQGKTPDVSCLPDAALETLIESEETVVESFVSSPSEVETGTRLTNKDTERSDLNNSEPVNDANFVTDDTFENTLELLQKHEKVSVSNRWSGKTTEDLKRLVGQLEELKKCTHLELNTMIDGSKDIQKKRGISIKKSLRHEEKTNAISTLIGSGDVRHTEITVRGMMDLKDIAAKTVKQNTKHVSKNKLNCMYASIIYEDRRSTWYASAPFEKSLEVDGLGTINWFSFPEYSEERQKLEPKCVDAHHLLVNLRTKICKDGVDGIKKEAWHAVANTDRTVISKSLVVDLLDKQNNAFAKRTFSKEVEKTMRKLHYNNEADFCKIVREWYEAEDSPSLSAMERTRRRLQMKSYLLQDVDFGSFPMFGSYVKGFPKGMYESFLQRIDTCIQLYAIVPSGSYNQRSISSLVNETFFGELSELEPTKLGCPKAISIPRLMSTVTEILHYRCDPSNRNFHINTTRKSVYPAPELIAADVKQKSLCSEKLTVEPMDVRDAEKEDDRKSTHKHTPMLSDLKFRDHPFDLPERGRRSQRVSKRSDISGINDVARGCEPVRARHHRSDESKILPTDKLGIPMKPLSNVLKSQ